MGNADAETKRVADEVTAANDDDGVAMVVELTPGRNLELSVGTASRMIDSYGQNDPLGEPTDVQAYVQA